MINDDLDVADLGNVLTIAFVCSEQAGSCPFAPGSDELEQFFGKRGGVAIPVCVHWSWRKHDALRPELRNQSVDGWNRWHVETRSLRRAGQCESPRAQGQPSALCMRYLMMPLG
jgi:hypothetical protein